MRVYILVLMVVFNTAFSQNIKCTIKEVQLDTYSFVQSNLTTIAKDFVDHNSLIEVAIEIQTQKISYFLISPANYYSGENKFEIKVWNDLDKFLLNIFQSCISDDNMKFDELKFRIPLSEENIKKAILQVQQISKN